MPSYLFASLSVLGFVVFRRFFKVHRHSLAKLQLIIGVDNAGNQIGIKSLEEERIQQIAHTYIYPNIVVHCHTVPSDIKLIGVVEITPTEKPHFVVKNIGRLAVNDIFIRHGSVVSKASPSTPGRK